jgi:hypothetical protein
VVRGVGKTLLPVSREKRKRGQSALKLSTSAPDDIDRTGASQDVLRRPDRAGKRVKPANVKSATLATRGSAFMRTKIPWF